MIQSERLTIPHYQMHLRGFVLFPLLDVAATLLLPSGDSVQALAHNVGMQGLDVISVNYPWQDGIEAAKS